ncbi:MAG: SIMPL domain-containing protein [Acidimicrobiales bacterium]|jgi:uncharacterized protein YggE
MSEGDNNHEHDHNNEARRDAWRGRRRGALVVVLAIAVLVLVGDILSAVALGRTSSSSARSTVSVTGSGTATGTPNTVSFQIGVSSIAKNASNALAANNARVSALEAALIKSGITKRNMQTSGLNIYQNTNNNGVVTGYTAEDDLSVTLHEISKAGAALDAATNAAGNGVQLSNLSYSISNQDSLYQKARTAAMKSAYAEASDIAKAAGETVGSIVRVSDQENSSGSTVPTPVFNTAVGKAASAVPVQAGSQTVTDQVSVVYALNG